MILASFACQDLIEAPSPPCRDVSQNTRPSKQNFPNVFGGVKG